MDIFLELYCSCTSKSFLLLIIQLFACAESFFFEYFLIRVSVCLVRGVLSRVHSVIGIIESFYGNPPPFNLLQPKNAPPKEGALV